MTGNGREAELIRSVGGRLEAPARRTGRIDLELASQIVEAGRVIAAVIAADGTVFAAGNGGSATQCQHLTSELVGRFRSDRPGNGEPWVVASPNRYGPWGVPSVVLQPPERIKECGDQSTCIADSAHCILAVPEEDVVEASMKLLAETRSTT